MVDHRERREKLRGWVSFIGAISGLIIALAALITAIKGGSTAKAAYEEHSRVITENQGAVAETHEQLEALRQHVDEHENAHQAIIVELPDAGTGRAAILSVGVHDGPPKVAPLKPQAPPRPFSALP